MTVLPGDGLGWPGLRTGRAANLYSPFSLLTRRAVDSVARVAATDRVEITQGPDMGGAGCPNRTDDLPLTRRVLYQLS
jgi:hypothetical protein